MPASPRRVRLGWLGPALLLIGALVGGLGVWWMARARPQPGPYVDVLALDEEWAVALRQQRGSPNFFLELRHARRGLAWRALVPPYAGSADALALAASERAIAVRFTRDGIDHLWALDTKTGQKMGALELGPSLPASAPVRLFGAGDRAYLVVRAGDGLAVRAIDLTRGAPVWSRDVGADEVFAATISDDLLVLARGPGGAARTAIRIADGALAEPPAGVFTPPPGPGWYPALTPAALAGLGQPPTPGAAPLRPHQRAGAVTWVVLPDQVVRMKQAE
ncbi:MAG: hypothetical protein KBG28_27650 [Kofleriaceae bacterium]|nr:hypothetical protein [Kofleriaceae bacterium]MBP6840065.1 hypothetical protein [Kofleriaceae bacterium]MBP9207770.1 hypothetical protein [Kofleriaceae bacterium]